MNGIIAFGEPSNGVIGNWGRGVSNRPANTAWRTS